MYFYKDLLTGPGIPNRSIPRIKWKLRHNIGQFTIYVLMLCPGSFAKDGNQLEICHCVNFQQKYYRDNPPWIIGVAHSRRDTVEMVRKLTQEAVEETGEADIIRYLFPDGVKDAFGRRAERAFHETFEQETPETSADEAT